MEYETPAKAVEAILKCKHVLKDMPLGAKSNIQFVLLSKNQKLPDGCGKWLPCGKPMRLVAIVGNKRYRFTRTSYENQAQAGYRKIVYKLNEMMLLQYFGQFNGKFSYVQFPPSRAAEILLGEPKIFKMLFDKKDNTYYVVKEQNVFEDKSGCYWTGCSLGRRYRIVCHKVTKKMKTKCKVERKVQNAVQVIKSWSISLKKFNSYSLLVSHQRTVCQNRSKNRNY